MSSQTQDVLLDSSTYFRLAASVHPLLKELCGDGPTYSFYVLRELDEEYARNVRLKHKFSWVQQSEYCQDRLSKRYEVRGSRVKEVNKAVSFLDAFVRQKGLNLSKEDIKALAVGFVNGLPVVTDDKAMREVAGAHDIKCWHTVALLKVMLTAQRLDMGKIVEIVEYWDYENDLPLPAATFRLLFKEYFQMECPI